MAFFIRFFLVLFLTINTAHSTQDKYALCNLTNLSFADIVQSLSPAVVNISTSQKVTESTQSFQDLFPQMPYGSPFDDMFKDFIPEQEQNSIPKEKTVTSLGSGFVISKDGYIITNNHVVNKADIIDIKFIDGKSLRAKIVGVDTRTDLALLKVETKEDLPFVEFGNSDDARVGDWIIAIGNPFGLGGTVTVGIISARGRNISDGNSVGFIQTDAAINRGNSGGPMFDSSGKLIGINTAIFSNSGGNIGIGFAIPSETALPVIEQLKATGKVVRGWLGVNIQEVTADMAEALDLDNPTGAYVVAVVDQSPAKKGGLKVDDLIIEYDGKKIKSMQKLPLMVQATPVGKKVKIIVLRNDGDKLVKKRLKVKIEKLLDEDQELADAALGESDDVIESEELLTMKLATLTKKLRRKYQISAKINGIIIVGFPENSEAQFIGLKQGDIITKANQFAVTSISQFKKIIAKNKNKGRRNILISVNRGGNTKIVITLPIN
jgi:serine protease Do